MIELFYNELSLKKGENSNIYFYNKIKILKKFDDLKKFNLDKKIFFISLKNLLKNES